MACGVEVDFETGKDCGEIYVAVARFVGDGDNERGSDRTIRFQGRFEFTFAS